ncbi:MAG: sel1 repeat family protein [Planctomycetaceae bacterium]|jgi:TPR repeat protein|nr:sel1 repeat family protein [Planctomycetaceae bacterium]
MTPDDNFDQEIEAFQEEVRNELVVRHESLQQYLEQCMEQSQQGNPSVTPEVFGMYFKQQFRHIFAMNGDCKSIDRLGRYYLEGLYGLSKDEVFAFRLFMSATLYGFEPSFVMLGQCYAYGIGTPRNIKSAAYWFELGLRYCGPSEVAFLGYFYHQGKEVPQDRQKAISYFVTAADMGHPDMFNLYTFAANEGDPHAQYMLGFIYLNGQVVPQDISTGLQWLQKSVEQNFAKAQCYLGIIYLQGLFGIEPDPQIAVQWFQLASKQGNDDATKYLAECLANGNGVTKNTGEAIRIWKKFAQKNNDEITNNQEYRNCDPGCQYMLGMLYFDETFPEYNLKEATKWLRQSAEQGYALAQEELGIRLLKGDGVKQNINDARHFLHKAAKQNLVVAQFYLAEIYAEGQGVPANRKEAFKWYKKSADAGYVPAQQVVANCYLHGIGTVKNESIGYDFLSILALWGDEEAFTLLKSAATSGNASAQFSLHNYFINKEKSELAISWLEKSVEQGLAVAQTQLAFIYHSEKNYEQYLHYLHLAAEQGDPEAQTYLALVYEDGIFVPKNDESAFRWMKKAADMGHVQANYYLGNLYRDGTGISANSEKAFECYKKSAEGGSSDGIDRLGSCYQFGVGVEPDTNIAFQLFQQATQLGNPKGQCNLGICYLEGIGCKQNHELAFKWISLAVKSGHPGVLRRIEEIGLDIEILSNGLYQFQQLQRKSYPEKQFEQSLNQIFQNEESSLQNIIPPCDPQ